MHISLVHRQPIKPLKQAQMPAKCDAAIMLKPINVKLLGIFALG